MTRKGKTKLGAILALVGVGAVALGACSGLTNKDVHSKPDHTVCIYDKEDGKLIEQLPPGANKKEVEGDAVVVEIPTSNRFYFVSPDSSVKDPGAPNYLTGRDASYKDMQMVVQIRFRFDVNKACKWFDQHGRRNADGNGSLGFNARGDANQGWARWLNENFAPAMQTVGEPLIFQYSWPHHEYNYPVNADDNGVIANGDEAGLLTREQMQLDFGANLSKNLTDSLGDSFFCGIDYDPAKPDVCPDIKVDIYSTKLVDQTPVNERKAVEALSEGNRIANDKAALIEAGTDAAIRQRKAELAEEKAIADEENAAAIEAETRRQQLLAAQQATKDLEAQRAAVDKLSVCAEAARINGGPISPSECALLLLALQGKSPAVPGGGIVVNGGS